MSIDLLNNTGSERRFDVPPAVRVRSEAFGLLFYNTTDSRLTYVRSGDLLRVEAVPCGAKRIAASLGAMSQGKVKRLLDHLLNKGLIGEA